jgi:predicted lipid-binding transport protein (Tim44 family)
MAAGPKKGSDKPIDLTDMHNRMVTKNPDLGLTNFSWEYRNTTNFNCLEEPFSSDPSDGCASSSYVALLSLEEGTIFAIYDQVASFGPAAADGDQLVLALTLSLNETKEATEAAEKIEAAKKRAEKEKEYEEARQQAQRDAAERRKRERREKNRKDKNRRAEFLEADRANIEEAMQMAKDDGEVVVLRTVDPSTVDIEKDTFFI